MSTFIAFVKAHWTIIAAIAGAVWVVIKPSVVILVAMHPDWTAILGAIGLIIAQISPAPASFWKGQLTK